MNAEAPPGNEPPLSTFVEALTVRHASPSMPHSVVFQRAPTAQLRPWVERFWSFEGHRRLDLPIVTPGVGAELFFHYETPFRAGDSVLARAHLICIRQDVLALTAPGSVGFVAVRIRAGALGRFTGVPLRKLANTQLDVRELWGSAGTELAERVASLPTNEQRIQAIEQFLLAQLDRARGDSVAERALTLIYRHYDSLRIEALAAQCGLGRRQLERRMKTYFGQSPVELRRLSRFYHAARRMALAPHSTALESALQGGYYDQAQFIHEFVRFTGFTPEAFRRLTAGRTHFYNPG